MTYRMHGTIGAVCAGCLAIGVAGAAEKDAGVEFSLQEGVVTVKTPRYVARFADGALVALTNRLTEETYTVATNDLPDRAGRIPHGLSTLGAAEAQTFKQVEALHAWQGEYRADRPWPFQHRPTSRSTVTLTRPAPNRALATWTGLQPGGSPSVAAEETMRLELTVLPETGDLEIRARVEGRTPGVYGCAVLLANFARDLELIVPVFQGFALRPADEKPFNFVAHWPYPWCASVVVLQGRRGSVGLWMADPNLADRYLFMRCSSSAVDVAFESLNPAPFDRSTAADSRPIRVNVYEGNWIGPADAFRQWWAKTFGVRPIAERQPALLREVYWMASWGTMPPKDLAAQAVYFCPQVWKKSPTVGDHGLFPFDMSPGPELGQLTREMLSQLKAMRCEPYVYVNISHFCRAHPWASRFWPLRLQPPFLDPRVEEDPKFGSPSSFVIHCAHKAWQDVIVDWTREINRRFGIIGFYMDCAAGSPNHRGGLVDGKNDCQGQVEILKRQKQLMPGCFLGAEYLTEVTAQVVDFAGIGFDNWFGDGEGMFYRAPAWRRSHVHPIIGFLYNTYVHLMYFGGQIPTFEETLGRLPLTAVRQWPPETIRDYAEAGPFIDVWARLRCRTRMRPVYPPDWAPGVRAYYADPDGHRYRIVADSPASSRLVRTAPDGTEELVYWRIQDQTRARLAPGKGIAGWVAYEGDTAIGLDPQSSYFYTADPRIADWQVTRLPEGACIRSLRPFRQGDLILELASLDDKPHAGPVEIVTSHAIIGGLTADGVAKVEPLSTEGPRRGYRMLVRVPGIAVFHASRLVSGAIPVQGGPVLDLVTTEGCHYALLSPSGLRTAIEPRRQLRPDRRQNLLPVFPEWGQSATLDYLIQLPSVPAGRRLRLRLGSWITHWKNNSYTLAVQVNGQDRLRVERKGGTEVQEHDVDLTAHAGRGLLLTLRVEKAFLFDYARLRQVRIVVE